jgi:hypothetical protein
MSDNRALNPSHLSGPQPTTELRTHRRYPITLVVQYKWNDRRAEQLGSGITINISSGGVLFRSTEILPVKSPIELALSWPVALDQCALKLVMRGRVVRSASHSTAVRVAQYEFRTAGGLLPARLFPKIS